MEINKHICFSKDRVPELVDYLQKNSVNFDNTNGLVTFDVLQSSVHWNTVQSYVQNHHLTCLSETSFSNKELENAEWLCVRSKWKCGYPVPESGFGYQGITYSNEHYCAACGGGLTQADSFRLRGVPKWGKRHFMMLNWVDDELFVDDIAKDVLESMKFTGLEFAYVKNKNGTALLSGVYQLVISSQSNQGFVHGEDSVQNVIVCPSCGRVKYHPSGIGMYSFMYESLKDMTDICKTAEFFGWGKSTHQLILVRQSVYRTIADNHLDRGLVFSPINLV